MALNIEVDPPNVPEEVLIDYIAEPLEASLDRRNSYKDPETGLELDVSQTFLHNSNWFSSVDAFYDIRAEHRQHMARLDEAGIDASNVMATAILGNLLTERNLPQYHSLMMRKVFGSSPAPESAEPLKRWVKTWTAEEHPHEEFLRDTLIATEIVPLKQFEQGAVKVETTDLGVEVDDLVNLWAYTMPQEGATEVSHANTAKLFSSTVRDGMEALSRNEATHKKAMTDFMRWAIEVDPDYAIQSLYRQVRLFQMPGKEGIPNFEAYAADMAVAGLYDFVEFRKLVRTSLKQLKIDSIDLSRDRSREYRDKLYEHVDDESRSSRAIDRRVGNTREKMIEDARGSGVIPFILGRTVRIERGKPPEPIENAV